VTDRTAGDGGVLCIAHRGDWLTYRENTVLAITSAIDAGADVVEVDVKTTSDGVSIVLHDDFLTRFWKIDRDVRTMTAAEVGAVLGDHADDRIPTLEEVLVLFSGTSTAVLIDMDSAEWADAALDAVRRAVDAGYLRASQVIWCGNTDAMLRIRSADRDARIFLSWGEQARIGPPDDGLLEQLRPEAFNPYWRLVLEAGGREWARGKGLSLSCWTVDDPVVMRQMVEAGVDAVISNRIHELIAVVRGD
jgi:glycerophosphoryl diester phosphodiesterase